MMDRTLIAATSVVRFWGKEDTKSPTQSCAWLSEESPMATCSGVASIPFTSAKSVAPRGSTPRTEPISGGRSKETADVIEGDMIAKAS